MAEQTVDTAIYAWHLEPTTLDDGSKVYDLIGASDEARVVINCYDEQVALQLQDLLNSQSASAWAA